MDHLLGPLGDFDLTGGPELTFEILRVLRLVNAEVDIDARSVGTKAAHGVPSDHEPVQVAQTLAATVDTDDVARYEGISLSRTGRNRLGRVR
ncbi:MAG: hypothetical protein V3T05_14315 [Myxococcota bacterium]